MNANAERTSDYFVMQSLLEKPVEIKQRRVIRAAHLGMCFGVRDAIALALEEAKRRPLTILGDLVHNEIVVAQLRGEGIQIQNQPEAVRTNAVMITAHGASEKMLRAVREQGLHALEATCPLVHHAHRAEIGRAHV